MQEGRDVADADVGQSLLQKAKGFTHTDVKVLAIASEAQEVAYNRYFPRTPRPPSSGCATAAASNGAR